MIFPCSLMGNGTVLQSWIMASAYRLKNWNIFLSPFTVQTSHDQKQRALVRALLSFLRLSTGMEAAF